MYASTTRKHLLEAAIALLILAPSFVIFYHNIAGDASIYFTFIKNFVSLPFSYQPRTVSFGASSPLHVLANVPLYLIFRENWLPVAKCVSYLLIVVGTVLVNRAINGNVLTLLMILLLTVLNTALLLETSAMYETGLAFFKMSLLYYCLRQKRYRAAVLVAGLLYLVRPELLLIAVALDLFIFLVFPDRKRTTIFACVSVIPAATYHFYMFINTGEYLPSSIYARAIAASEDHASWLDSLARSLQFIPSVVGLIYLVGILAIALLIVQKRLRAHKVEMILILPVSLLYIALPPREYIIRYLLPITPIITALAVLAVMPFVNSVLRKAEEYLRKYCPSTTFRIEYALLVATVLLIGIIYGRYVPFSRHPRYDYDTVLLKDLAERLNVIAAEKDKILIYEIQGQYYLNSFCYSLDGIVGNQLFDVLTRRDTFANFIVHNNVRYIVTMNAFNFRKIYGGTLLEKLYEHDLSSNLGDTVEIDHIIFRKLFSNPVFSDPKYYILAPRSGLNTGVFLRVYGDWNPLWAGHGPLWNSVYELQVLSTAAKER